MITHWQQSDEVHSSQQTKVPQTFLDRLYALRDRLLSDPWFQRFSAAFPFTRGIARKEAMALFDLCAGFVYSQILAACIELELFEQLKKHPKTLAQLSRQLAIPPERLHRLLLAAVSLRLVSHRSGGRFGLGMLGAALLGNPGIPAMVRHHTLLYRDLSDPVSLLRGKSSGTELAQYWRYAGLTDASALGADQVEGYSRLMAASQSFIAEDVLEAYPFGEHKCLLDVGGGEGAFIAAAAAKHLSLRFMMFDFPAVGERASSFFFNAGIGGRVAVKSGSFLDGALPEGADIISLVRVVHDHDDAAVMKLLHAVHDALPPGGTVLIAEPMAGTPGAEPVGDAYFGMYLLAMGSGRPRTPADLKSMLSRAGFGDARQAPTRRPMLASVITAQK